MSHSPEPWTLDGNDNILDSDECYVLTSDAGDPVLPDVECLKRIVACVNFCRQFPTEWLAEHQLHFAKDTALPTPNEGYTGLCVVVKNGYPHE